MGPGYSTGFAEQIKSWVMDGAQTVLKSAATMGGSIALGVMDRWLDFS